MSVLQFLSGGMYGAGDGDFEGALRAVQTTRTSVGNLSLRSLAQDGRRRGRGGHCCSQVLLPASPPQSGKNTSRGIAGYWNPINSRIMELDWRFNG